MVDIWQQVKLAAVSVDDTFTCSSWLVTRKANQLLSLLAIHLR